jgi:hypothetical protein
VRTALALTAVSELDPEVAPAGEAGTDQGGCDTAAAADLEDPVALADRRLVHSPGDSSWYCRSGNHGEHSLFEVNGQVIGVGASLTGS